MLLDDQICQPPARLVTTREFFLGPNPPCRAYELHFRMKICLLQISDELSLSIRFDDESEILTAKSMQPTKNSQPSRYAFKGRTDSRILSQQP